MSKSHVDVESSRQNNHWVAKKNMSINQDSTTQNNGPSPAMFNRNSYMSQDGSLMQPTRFIGQQRPAEYHSLMNMPPGHSTLDSHRSFPVQATGLSIKREVKFRWDNQKDCVQVDRVDGRASFLITNTSAFTWKCGLNFILQIGDDRKEYNLPEEVKSQNDTKCEFDLREFADRQIGDLPIVLYVNGSWTDPATKEKTKYFSEKLTVGKIEFK
jgi:hypothetical protein